MFSSMKKLEFCPDCGRVLTVNSKEFRMIGSCRCGFFKEMERGFLSSEIKVYSEKGKVTVTTEEIVRKNFESLNLPTGKYTLVLTTIYGDNVEDEFRQEFEVGKTEFFHNIKNNWILFVILGGAVIVLIIIFIFFHKRKKNKNE